MRKTTSLLLAFAVPLTVFAAFDPNPVYSFQAKRAESQSVANRERVKKDLAAIGLKPDAATWYAVPAMSDVMRLDDVFPADGTLRGAVDVILARDEYESASFELFTFKDFADVQVEVSPLKSGTGAIIPSERIDLTVSKPWFQNGNAWICYFADVGRKLSPELLLHDENLIKVDLNPKNPANYARLTLEENGKKKTVHRWISAPKAIGTILPLFNEGFADADRLLPVTLKRDRFRQFVITVHATAAQAPGLYRGTITARRDKQILAEIPLSVRVLPFVLPEPHPYDNIDAPFYVSLMSHHFNRGWILAHTDGDEKLADEIWEKSLRSYRAHNILNPAIGVFSSGKEGEAERRHYKEIGFATNMIWAGGADVKLPWMSRHYGGRLTYTEYRLMEHSIARAVEVFTKQYPNSIMYHGYGDEPGVGFVQAYRRAWEYTLDTPLYMTVAGHAAVLNKGGHVYRGNPMGAYPDDPDVLSRVSKWKQIDSDMKINFYAGQHNGVENPQYIRYQHGLLGYFNGLTGVDNYEFGVGDTHFNDFDSVLYKPMAVSYLCRSGLLETFAFLGFREAIDDIRYVTALKRLCREAKASTNREAIVLARKALLYLAQLDRSRMDLNAIRLEVINYTLKLRALLAVK